MSDKETKKIIQDVEIEKDSELSDHELDSVAGGFAPKGPTIDPSIIEDIIK